MLLEIVRTDTGDVLSVGESDASDAQDVVDAAFPLSWGTVLLGREDWPDDVPDGTLAVWGVDDDPSEWWTDCMFYVAARTVSAEVAVR